MNKVKSIVVFCASSLGHSNVYAEEAKYLGQTLVQRGIRLVYGGGRVGLMGTIANAVLDQGGEVIGVIPHFLNSKEREHTGVTKLITVDSMHDRKRIMNEHADAAIALPGGFGTLEELFEMITWGQLGLHRKPVGILNTNGFYDHLIDFIAHMVDEGLLKEENRDMLLVGNTIAELLDQMEHYSAPQVTKWVNKEQI